MPRRLTIAELERAGIAKTTRTLVRLKHSLAADEELNTLLPATLDDFDEALAAGELKGIKARLDDVLKG
jgi:hypothetical protein